MPEGFVLVNTRRDRGRVSNAECGTNRLKIRCVRRDRAFFSSPFGISRSEARRSGSAQNGDSSIMSSESSWGAEDRASVETVVRIGAQPHLPDAGESTDPPANRLRHPYAESPAWSPLPEEADRLRISCRATHLMHTGSRVSFSIITDGGPADCHPAHGHSAECQG